MRLSDADREQLFALLTRHAASGRLAFDELEQRIEQVAKATTREAAAEVLADLPPLPAEAPRPTARRGRRGHGEAETPAPDWTPTPERFRDPRSGAVMRVWTDPHGGRHYLRDA